MPYSEFPHKATIWTTPAILRTQYALSLPVSTSELATTLWEESTLQRSLRSACRHHQEPFLDSQEDALLSLNPCTSR
jgi:hypothetical protein